MRVHWTITGGGITGEREVINSKEISQTRPPRPRNASVGRDSKLVPSAGQAGVTLSSKAAISSSEQQTFLKHAISDYLVRDIDFFPLRLSN